jgi:hypothetical protein
MQTGFSQFKHLGIAINHQEAIRRFLDFNSPDQEVIHV